MTQPSKGVLSKTCSENMQQIYRRTLMPKCDFNKVAKQPTKHNLKACVCYFLSNFYFQPNNSPSKIMKNVTSFKKLFSFARYSNFCISVFLS